MYLRTQVKGAVAVAHLVASLSRRQLLGCVNLMVVADHGMAHIGPDRHINLLQFRRNLTSEATMYHGSVPKLQPHNEGNYTHWPTLHVHALFVNVYSISNQMGAIAPIKSILKGP